MIYRQADQKFDLVSDYQPTGDQPEAIDQLTKGIENGDKAQILLGATGTGKTFTISNVIANVNKPTLILSHNKTLAGQLYGEMKKFFPHNAVEYFVSYYDYYQPEAYVPSSDTYIEKDASINDEIDKLRNAATTALLERNDVIVVASVSSIFGLGNPNEYQNSVISLHVGQEIDRDFLLRQLVTIQYDRNDIDFQRGRFRVHGDVVEIFPASHSETALRIEFFGDEIDRIREVDALTGEVKGDRGGSFDLPCHPLHDQRGHYGRSPAGNRAGHEKAGQEVYRRGKFAGSRTPPAADDLRHRDDAGDGLYQRD